MFELFVAPLVAAWILAFCHVLASAQSLVEGSRDA